MEDGEIVNEEFCKDATDVSPKIEKCVVDENAHENSDKEDGELEDGNDSDNVTPEQEDEQNVEPGDVNKTDSPDDKESQIDAQADKKGKEKNSSLEKDIENGLIIKDEKNLAAEDEEGELCDKEVPTKSDGVEQKPAQSQENAKEAAPVRMEFDEARPEEEQLDYGEDELEEKIKEPKEVEADRKKSDGEVDSDSEGEIKSDAGDDFEEGETRDHPSDVPPEKKKVCRFFEIGNCTWGDRCRYLHPGINDKGNYDMFCDEPPKRREPPLRREFHPLPRHVADPFWEEPPPFIPPPAAETAWEKGLRHAKEMKKRALQRKVQEPDFLQKRQVISTIGALNEDRDMEFVNIAPLTNKGYDPFKEEETGEYATPTAEEVRRHLNRDRRQGPPSQRHLSDKGQNRLPPPVHMMHSDSRREQRPTSPRRERFHHEGRGLSPRRNIERERPRHYPPNEPGLAPQLNDRHDRHDFPAGANQGMHHPDIIHRDPGLERGKDERYLTGDVSNKGGQNGGPPSGQSQSWNDPWARGRPQTKGRNKAKSDSSSSSDSSSGSSSRSSSSGSSRSSYSSKSSSSGSDSTSYSSSRDSSRSPSPSSAGKKKVLATAKQRNAVVPGAMKKNLPATLKPSSALKPVAQILPGAAALTMSKSMVPNTIPPLRKPPVVPNQAMPIAPQVKTMPKKKVRKQSSSSSEFSHSSDSSPSPAREKNNSGSDSDSSSGSSSSSASSSSSSSSSDSEGDKPANRRKRKPIKPQTSQQQHPLSHHQVLPQQQQPINNKGKVMVPSKPGRKDIKMTIIDKPGMSKKRPASEMSGQGKKSTNRRNELLEQLKAVEDAIARKRAKLT